MVRWDPRRYVWEQIAEIIAARIADGTYGPHHRLAELQLAEEFGVARATIRRALQALREQGLVVTLLGRGSYPTTPVTGDQGEDDEEMDDKA